MSRLGGVWAHHATLQFALFVRCCYATPHGSTATFYLTSTVPSEWPAGRCSIATSYHTSTIPSLYRPARRYSRLCDLVYVTRCHITQVQYSMEALSTTADAEGFVQVAYIDAVAFTNCRSEANCASLYGWRWGHSQHWLHRQQSTGDDDNLFMMRTWRQPMHLAYLGWMLYRKRHRMSSSPHGEVSVAIERQSTTLESMEM